MDCLERLDDTTLPAKEAFFSRLKNEGISDEDYASCQEAWRENNMTTLREFLVWYNKRNVVPFLQATDRQLVFFSIPGSDLALHVKGASGEDLLYAFQREEEISSSPRQRSRGWRCILYLSPLSRERGHQATSGRVRRGHSTVSIDRRLRCQRIVVEVPRARHADEMVHMMKGRERVPTRIGAAVPVDGCGMVDVGIRTHGTRHTTSDQRSREENRQPSGGPVVQ